MFKHLTLKKLAVLVLMIIIKLTLSSEIFLGVRQGIINLFNFSSINFNLLEYLSVLLLLLLLKEVIHFLQRAIMLLKDLRIK